MGPALAAAQQAALNGSPPPVAAGKQKLLLGVELALYGTLMKRAAS